MVPRLATRTVLAVLQIAFVSLLVYVLLALSPGDPARDIAGEFASPHDVAVVRTGIGLDRPLLVQYGKWLTGAAHGDFGHSWRTNEPVSTVLARALGTSMSLLAASLLVAVAIALVAGTLSALRPRG